MNLIYLSKTSSLDIYVMFEKDTGKPIEFLYDFAKPTTGRLLSKDVLTKGQPNLEVAALVVSYWADYSRAHNSPNAFFQLKLKQLELMGFRLVLVSI